MAFDLGTLTKYTDQTSAPLIQKLYYDGDSTKYMKAHAGVNVGTFAINYFDIAPQLKLGSGCGVISDDGTTTFNQKNISVCKMFTQGAWCPADLQEYYLGMEIQGVRNDNLKPVDEILVDQLIHKTGNLIETAIWDNTSMSGSTCFGMFQKISGDTARISINTGVTITISNILQIVQDAVMALPLELLDDEELILMLSPTFHSMFKQAWFKNNNFQYPAINEHGDFVIEQWGPKFVIHKTYGLQGSNNIYLTTMKNMHVAFTGEKDSEKVDVWFETYDQQIHYRINLRLGVTWWLADYVVCNF